MSEDATLDEFVREESKEDSKSEWSESKLEDLLSELLTGGRPTGGGLDEGEYISIGGTQVNSEGYIDLHDLVYIPEEYFEQVKETQLQKHDILVVKDGANTGDVAIAWESDERIVTNEHLFSLRANSSINSPYLFYFLLSHQGWKQINGTITGSAQEGINRGVTGKVDVQYPPLPEQRKIATVLHTVDRAIENTNEIIGRNDKLKRGLRQDIFQQGGLSGEKTKTRRIGPKEYEMPEDWKVTNLSQVAEIKGGQGFKSSNFVDEGVPLIKISNVQNGFLDLQDTSYLPEEYLNKYSEAALSEGDVVLVLTRPIIGDGIKAARIDQNDRFLLNQRLAVLDPVDENTITREYLYHLIFTNIFIDQVKATVRATHQPNLSKTDLQNFSIPVPRIEQQREICRLLRNVEDVVEKNKSYRSNLKRMKRGIMQDLLSGTVLTTDTNIQVPEEIAQYG